MSKQLGWYKSKPEYVNAVYVSSLPNYKMYILLMINGTRSKVFSALT